MVSSLPVPLTKPVYTSPVTNTCYMSGPSHSSKFDHPNNIKWAVQLVTTLVGGPGLWEAVCCIEGLSVVSVHVTVPDSPFPHPSPFPNCSYCNWTAVYTLVLATAMCLVLNVCDFTACDSYSLCLISNMVSCYCVVFLKMCVPCILHIRYIQHITNKCTIYLISFKITDGQHERNVNGYKELLLEPIKYWIYCAFVGCML